MHVARAKKPPQVGDIIRDKPSAILRDINMRRLDVAVEQTDETEQERKRDCDQYRPKRNAKHPPSATVNESRHTYEEANRNAHPPRGEKPDHRSTNALWQWCVNETKLPEFELGEILRRDRVTDLVVCDAVKTGHEHGNNDDENINAELFKGTHDAGLGALYTANATAAKA